MIPAAGLPQVVELRDLAEVRSLLRDMRVSGGGIKLMDKKCLFRVVRVKGLDTRAANILKQEMLSRGGEVATSREVYELDGRNAECLIMGTVVQYERLLPKLRQQPFGLRALADAIAAVLEFYAGGAPAVPPRARSLPPPSDHGYLERHPRLVCRSWGALRPRGGHRGSVAHGRRGRRPDRRGGRIDPAGFRSHLLRRRGRPGGAGGEGPGRRPSRPFVGGHLQSRRWRREPSKRARS